MTASQGLCLYILHLEVERLDFGIWTLSVTVPALSVEVSTFSVTVPAEERRQVLFDSGKKEIPDIYILQHQDILIAVLILFENHSAVLHNRTVILRNHCVVLRNRTANPVVFADLFLLNIYIEQKTGLFLKRLHRFVTVRGQTADPMPVGGQASAWLLPAI